MVTSIEPILLNQPKPSTTPRKRRIAPPGARKLYTDPDPVPVNQSPIQKIWFRLGEIEEKAIPSLRCMGAGPGGSQQAAQQTLQVQVGLGHFYECTV